MKTIETIVCVHGFWSHGAGMYLLKRRFEKEYGLRALLFNYPSVRGSLDENADALAAYIDTHCDSNVHLVGHSLGGVVALRALAQHADIPPGRVVCLGSPLTGSRSAYFLQQQQWAQPIIGRSLPAGVLEEPASCWAGDTCSRREVGVIAGNTPLGVGQFVAEFDEDNDGTVSVSETRLAGTRDHLVLPVSHYGMLVSRSVADQAAAFLKRGEFLRELD